MLQNLFNLKLVVKKSDKLALKILYLHNTGGIFGHHGFGRHGSNRSEIIFDFSAFLCNSASFPEQYPLASFFN